MQPDPNNHIPTDLINKAIIYFNSEGHSNNITMFIAKKVNAVKVANALRKLHFSCYIEQAGSCYTLTVTKP